MMARAVPSFRISGPAAASLLVNGLLIAALLNLGMGPAARRQESPALTVLSLAQLKGVEQGAEEREAASAGSSQTAEQRPVVRPSVSSAVVQPLRMDQSPPSTLVPIAPVAPVASPVMTTSDASGAERAAASPATSSLPPRGVEDGADIKAPSGTSRSYAAKVRSWLYAHKIYPRRARMRREEGQVQVRFILDRAGTLLEGAIIRGSGNPVLDEEARAMLQRASPYPRAPVELPGERIEFSAPIEFILPA